MQGERRMGTLYLKSDLGLIYERFRLYALIAVVILVLSALIAYAVATALQRQISQPILALAKAARSVSENRDYSVRAPPVAGHELGLLTDAFNHMLTHIEEGQARLQSQLTRLDLLHRITRAIGERQDLPSIFQVLLRTLEDELPIDFGCVCLYEVGTDAASLATIGARSEPLARVLNAHPRRGGSNRPERACALREGRAGLRAGPVSSISVSTDASRAGGLCSLVIAPLLVENRVFGVLVAARRAAMPSVAPMRVPAAA